MRTLLSLLSVSLVLPLSSRAWAQEEPAPPVTAEAPSAAPELVAEAPVEAPITGAAVTAEEVQQNAEPVAEEALEEEESSWYEDLSFGIFADAYYMVDWDFPSDPQAWSDVPHRAYDAGNGFGLAFAGADLLYEGEKVGGTISLRYGQGAAALIGGRAPEMSVLWQGYVSWMPTEELSFDLGQFGTIYGAEVAESFLNLNYTRGALYYLMQPFYHTGLRATYEVSDLITVKGMVVNGTNNLAGTIGLGEDGNQSPHVGGQVGITPSDNVGIYLGYYTGAGASGFGLADTDGDGVPDNREEDGDWEHFVDVVATASLGDLTLIGNADFYALPSADVIYWGVSAAAGYSITDKFGVAARAEFLHDPDGFISAGAYEWLTTATATLDYSPVEPLTIRLDTRFEFTDTDAFIARNELRSFGIASTLGVVAHYGM